MSENTAVQLVRDVFETETIDRLFLELAQFTKGTLPANHRCVAQSSLAAPNEELEYALRDYDNIVHQANIGNCGYERINPVRDRIRRLFAALRARCGELEGALRLIKAKSDARVAWHIDDWNKLLDAALASPSEQPGGKE